MLHDTLLPERGLPSTLTSNNDATSTNLHGTHTPPKRGQPLAIRLCRGAAAAATTTTTCTSYYRGLIPSSMLPPEGR